MLKFIRWFVAVSLLLTVMLAAAGYYGLSHWYKETQLQLSDTSSERLLEVRPGTHARRLTSQLATEGFIASPELAYWAVRLFQGGEHIQAGVYQVRQGETLAQFWQKIAEGQQHYFSITFAEGLNFKEWRQRIAEHPWLRKEWAHLSATEVMAQLAPEAGYTLPEGLLFPDTYQFHAYTSDRQLYQQAYARMQEVLMELWPTRSAQVPLETPYQALILASLVEKETGAAHERGLVASVFVNRLNKGMRLQSDPTIVYGLGERYRGVIYRSDIQETTPYNTYRINGLPPTPIAMPGREAIAATLQPDVSDYFYFVSRNDGTHVFSKTLREHNRAVQHYQRNK
ncbi:endolytic transglycosylase MltG [Aliidiomarina taiwanensis]|uniref:Endolytic murein transglycosylase n=1 Tax=Aliidiomarina taiwanensis TaxID=946228 RepID=A0A432X9F2_9GAMM|nr:endolytic transglycosylase MltG [Aliidiomarina taiwanensis]RUO44055.1 endolytic transglycosylase MltG [Aliidiomarina taiwanensis]